MFSRDPVQRHSALVDRHVAQVEPAFVDRTVGDADDHERQARPGLHYGVTRVRQPFVQLDQDCAGSLRRDLAAQFGEQCFGAQRFEDRETLPCRRGRPPGGALGEQRSYGTHRLARPGARTAGGPGGRDRSARQVVPRTGRTRAPGRAGRARWDCGDGATRAAGGVAGCSALRTVSWRSRCPATRTLRWSPPGSNSKRCQPPPPPCGPPWRRRSPTPIRTSSSSEPGCSAYRSPASAKRPRSRTARRRRYSRHDSATRRHDPT